MKLDRMYLFYADPGHAWVKVPVAVLKELGIAKKITTYSYISRSGLTAYLEEDVDAVTLRDALVERGIDPRSTARYFDNYSSIRRLPRYPSC